MQEKAAQRLLPYISPRSRPDLAHISLHLPCQVMQEKAAQRLLAQTLHQQMLEELRNNPQLAADPEQQLQFRRLAQQQLLFQMALAAQVTSRPYLACISRISRL